MHRAQPLFRLLTGMAAWLILALPPAARGETLPLLVVGCDDDWAPFVTRDRDGQPAGFAVDILREAARESGLSLEMKVDHVVALARDLRGGKIDALITSPGPPVPTNVLPTAPFCRSQPALYGRAGEALRPGMPEAAGRKLAEVQHLVTRSNFASLGWSLLPVPLRSPLIGLRLVAEGELDFVLVDRLVASPFIKNYRIRGVAPLDSMNALAQPYCFYIRADRPDLAQKINAGLIAIKADGRYSRIYNHWFGIEETPPPSLRDLLPYFPALVLLLALLATLHLWRLERRTLALRDAVRSREALQARLGESEDQFRQIAENISEVFWVSSLDKKTMHYVSPAYARIWGRPVRALLDQPHSWLDAIHPEDQLRVRESALTRQADGTYDEIYRISRPDGTTRWIRDRAFPVRDPKGEITRLVGIAEDITEQRTALARVEQLNKEQEAVVALRTRELTQANQALSASQERLNALLHAIPDMVFRVDSEGTFLDYSAPHTATFAPPDRIIGRNLRDMNFPEAMVRDTLAALARALATDKFVTYEYTLDTEECPRHYEARVVKSGPGELVAAVRDITERRNYEEQRRSLEAKLFESQKMEAMGTLAGGIAHDFNNILGAILGYSELLQLDPAVPEDTRNTLKEITRAGQRGVDMIRQILTFSRRQLKERRPLSLQPIIRESIRFLRSSLPATVDIATDLAADTAAVNADPTQMQQVLMNLCTNAAYAMRDRPGRLEVTLRNEVVGADPPRPGEDVPPGRYVVLSVRDTGVGIPERVLARIFEPFYTTKPAGEGTGLGLSVVHGIVKDHEGYITVHSRSQVGTVFQVHLPALETPVASAPEEAEQYVPGHGEHVLFVDDEVPMADMVKRLLTQMGYRVTAFSRPQEAAEAFMVAPQRFDVVITDLNMPRLSGLDLARAVHATDPAKPVILVSGFLAGEQFPTVEETGIREMLAKPFTARQLSAALRRALDGQGAA